VGDAARLRSAGLAPRGTIARPRGWWIEWMAENDVSVPGAHKDKGREHKKVETKRGASPPLVVRFYAAAACAFLLRLRFGLAGAGSWAEATGSTGWGAGASAAGCSICGASSSSAPW
jgi:hypothetical protein